MSKQGIEIAASVFAAMQDARERLLRLGSRPPVDTQDIQLSQMMERGKDAIKDEFSQITMMKT